MIESFKLPTITPETLTGSIVSFNDEYGGLPLKSCTSLITGYQEGSGIPSPQNERPLHAFSSASLGKCDNNTASLWTIDNSFNGDVEFNQLLPTAYKDFTNTVTDTRNFYLVFRKSISPYTSLIATSITNTGLFQTIISARFDGDAQFLHSGSQNNITITPSNAISVINGHKYIVSMLMESIDTGAVGGLVINDIFIIDLTAMFGSTIADYIYNLEQTEAGAGVAFFKTLYPNDYYPYNAGTKQLVGDTLATFTFGQSIYQGSVDWKRGVVVVTHGRLDLGSLTWTKESNHFYSNILSDAKYPPNNSTLAEILCESYNVIIESNVASEVEDYSIGMSRTGRIYIYDSSLSSGDATAFTTAVTGVKLAYKLATPIEIPLGGINLLTQEGQNNIFADCGDTEVKRLKVN